MFSFYFITHPIIGAYIDLKTRIKCDERYNQSSLFYRNYNKLQTSKKKKQNKQLTTQLLWDVIGFLDHNEFNILS